MFSSLDIFKTASALAAHSTARQTIISQNIANADTPGYQAKDIKSFADSYSSGLSEPFRMRTTRAAHIRSGPAGPEFGQSVIERKGDGSPNGNSVSLEREMLNAAETKYTHDVALTIYRSGLNLIRTSLGRA